MRFKSVVGAFFFLSVASVVALVIAIQTRSFGGLLTHVLTDLAEKKTHTSVSLKNIQISFFPPGLEFNRVQVDKELGPGSHFHGEFGKLGFYIGLIELEEKDFTLGEIRISDSVIDYTFKKSDDEVKEIDKAVIDQVFNVADHLPVHVDMLLIENSRITANHELVEAKRLKIMKRHESFMLRFHLSNLNPVDGKDFVIDEIWGDLEVKRDQIDIHRLKVQHDVQTLLVKGKVTDYRLLKNASASLNGEAHLHLKNLKNDFPLPGILSFDSGNAFMDFRLNLHRSQMEGESHLTLNDLRSSFLDADQMKALLTFHEKKISLDKLELGYKDQTAELLRPATLYSNQHLFPEPIEARVANFDLGNAIKILGPSFGILKGRLSGDLAFRFDKGDLFFEPANGFKLSHFGLVVGESQLPIVMLKEAHLRETELAVVKGEFQMRSTITSGRTEMEVDGFVNKKETKFSVTDAKVNLEDLGNIAKLDIKGEGRLSINVSGPLDDVSINLKGKTKGFEILGYRLGETEKDITIDLRDSNVIINHMDAKFRSTPITGSGSVNYKNLDIALGINSPGTNFDDLTQILHPILGGLDFLPQDLNLNARVDAQIFGKTKGDLIRVKGDVNFTDLTAYGEHFSSGKFHVGFANRKLTIDALEANKEGGDVAGDFSFNIPDKLMDVSYRWENLKLSSFNVSKLLRLNVDGKISGSFKGRGTPTDYQYDLKTRLFNTTTTGYSFEDTLVDLRMTPGRVKGEAQLFGPLLRSNFDLSLKQGHSSHVNLDVNVSDVKPILTAVLGQHVAHQELKGSFRSTLKSDFKENFRDLNLTGMLQELRFHHPDFNVDYASTSPEFVIQGSEIKKWNLDIKQNDLFLVTKGSGNLSGQYSLINELYFNSKVLEILLSPVLSSEGFIRSIVRFNGSKGDFNFSASTKASGLNLTLDMVPVPLNDIKYSMEFADRRLTIQEITTALSNGQASLKGDIFFDGNDPDINLKYVLTNAEIPILGKSSMELSGEGTVLGSTRPYMVNGDIVVNRAQVVNELSDFSSKSGSLNQMKYLPRNQESQVAKVIQLNVGVKTENPIRITNSLTDIALLGELRLLGNPTKPRAEGRLYVPPNTSRVFFKNNEYVITGADLNFAAKKEISNPDFTVQAMTVLSTYRVYVKAYGNLETFNFDLTSEPALPRNSILSLIAFGYTEEIQSSMSTQQRENLTQVGVGSFVFDRLKISDILNKQFGLQVNLGTVIEQSNTQSLISGASQDAQGTALGRTRSATKIELKKRLDEATSMSVSSTMGGTIGQRQRMDLTYGVNKKIQVQGIYEIRTNSDGEEDIIDTSAGGDLKLRWTFK